MPHWKLTLSYNGAGFHGWQVQPGLDTVQGRLADALRKITGEVVLPQGSGRTDTGVHALAQVSSFSLRAAVPPPNLQRALNRALPPGIRVDRAELVPASFHARHSARRKIYEYRIFERRGSQPRRIEEQTEPAQPAGAAVGGRDPESICSPFLAPFVWDCRWALHFDLLQAAAKVLTGTHDFTAMAAAERRLGAQPEGEGPRALSRPNPVKTISTSEWSRSEGLLVYRICGSGFLHHMVRNLVGTMVDIGRGSLKLEELPKIIVSRDRAQAGPTAPAGGLFLVAVEYGEQEDGACPQGQEPLRSREGIL